MNSLVIKAAFDRNYVLDAVVCVLFGLRRSFVHISSEKAHTMPGDSREIISIGVIQLNAYNLL